MTISAPIPYIPAPPGPFMNRDGELQFLHRTDETNSFVLDLISLGYVNDPYIKTGAVSTATLEDVSGPTISVAVDVTYGGDHTGNKGVTLSVSGDEGTATLVVTFANGVVREIPMRFCSRAVGTRSRIYS